MSDKKYWNVQRLFHIYMRTLCYGEHFEQCAWANVYFMIWLFVLRLLLGKTSFWITCIAIILFRYSNCLQISILVCNILALLSWLAIERYRRQTNKRFFLSWHDLIIFENFITSENTSKITMGVVENSFFKTDYFSWGKSKKTHSTTF